MDLILGVVLFFGAIGTLTLLVWDTFQSPKPITKTKYSSDIGLEQLNSNKREECYLTQVNNG